MAVKTFKPITPGRRQYEVSDFAELTAGAKPYKPLLVSKNKSGGRNDTGRITVRHIGGGNRNKYRIIDFKRDKDGIPAKVQQIEYDPNRSANIALVNYADGTKKYILAPVGLSVGDTIVSGENVDIKVGNCLKLKDIPDGTVIHNLEMQAGHGAQIARSAGVSATLLGKENGMATVKMPSGETRKISLECRATIGVVGNIEHSNISLGKAGRTRHMGVRPTVRGVVMNPIDHKHGGGEGKSPIGLPGPVTPWGKPALGYKTRKKKKPSSRFIIKRIN
ncbi:MAG: 50S ribosomal protein L2 [Clostridia bacterium]|nr:50S ribosomal protein L2 [Clostridia bacterium]